LIFNRSQFIWFVIPGRRNAPKELESPERLVKKVGRIDLHAGDGRASTRWFA
jgi:hypothetical protein